jgi:hypothetical protein
VVEELILHIFGLRVVSRIFIPEGKKRILLGAPEPLLPPFPDEQHQEQGKENKAEKNREQKDAHERD